MRTWIIGAGGLFGSALVRASDRPFTGTRIPWDNTESALRALHDNLESFRQQAGTSWCIAWAAGHATTSSSQEQADRELDLFRRFIAELDEYRPSGRGVFLLTSSAGGIYAGCSSPPFSSTTPPNPTGVYGQLKLSQEISARELIVSMPTTVVRLSNLYGPGQDLNKLQGVISRLALAAVTRQPITMFVPLDTVRDYIFTDDAAARALHWAQVSLERNESFNRVVASGQPATLGYIIALMSDITRVRIPIASGFHDSARAQARDLRLIPDVDETVDHMPLTPLPAGVKTVFSDIQRRHAGANLHN